MIQSDLFSRDHVVREANDSGEDDGAAPRARGRGG
jgi:hypothetical protein